MCTVTGKSHQQPSKSSAGDVTMFVALPDKKKKRKNGKKKRFKIKKNSLWFVNRSKNKSLKLDSTVSALSTEVKI